MNKDISKKQKIGEPKNEEKLKNEKQFQKNNKKAVKKLDVKKENQIKVPEKPKEEKKIVKKVKEKRKKTEQEKKIVKLKEKIKEKTKPTFRGRFGKRFKRKKTMKKWDKWRRPRGIDIVFKNEDGALTKIGYRSSKTIRFLHPSGFKEVMVSNPSELLKLKDDAVVVRFSGKIGKRKRIQMIKIAKEQKIKILNRWSR